MVSPLAALRRGVLRPQDARDIYKQPARYFLRWEQEGVLLKLSHGYYAHVPEAERGGPWRPEIEAIALGIGQADYGRNGAALMHLSAARIHAAIPRAIAVAVLAVPKQRPILETDFGRIHFVKRDIDRLKIIRTETELGAGWVTNIEQSTLDLIRRRELVSGMEWVVDEALKALIARCNIKKLKSIAEDQRMKSALLEVLKLGLHA